MKQTVEAKRSIAALVIACVMLAGPLSALAQEPKLRQALLGHDSTVTHIVFGADGKSLASCSDDATIKIWDALNGKCTMTLVGHKGRVKCIAFGPTGRLLASASWDKTVKLWEVASGKCIATLEGHGREVNSVAFSPDGNKLASGGNNTHVLLWHVPTLKNTASFKYGDGACSVVFSPDGKTLAAGGGRVKLWDLASGKETATGETHFQLADSLAFSPDSKMLASAGGSTGLAGVGRLDLYLWDAASGKKLFSSETLAGLFASFSPDGKILATAGLSPKKIQPVDFGLVSLNSQRVKRPPVSAILLWDVATRKVVTSLQSHEDHVYCGAFSPDGKMLASGSRDKNIKLWELQPVKVK